MAQSDLKTQPDKKSGWIYTIQGCRTAHHVYMRFPRDAKGKPIKSAPFPVVSRKARISADLVSTCLWHPVEQQLYLYAMVIDIDTKGTREDLFDEQGRICATRLRHLITKELPRSSPFIKLVRSTSGRGIHAWIFFPAFPLNSEDQRYDRQKAMANKSLKALRRVLQEAGYGADDKALGLHHLYGNWRNPDLGIDRDIPFLQARIRRSLDDEHKQYARILSIVYDELRAREELKDIFMARLTKLYRDQRISDKLMSFVLANHAALKSWETLRFRCSELLAALGISKNSLPKLVAGVTEDAPTLGIRIERDLSSPGYYLVSRGTRFEAIHLAKPATSERRAGTKTQSIDVLAPLKFPEEVADGERNHEVCKAILKLKLSGVDQEKAARIISIYVQRAIKDELSMTSARWADYVTNIYANRPHTKGCIPKLAPSWLLSISTSLYPKSLKGELKSGFPGANRQPGPDTGQPSDQTRAASAAVGAEAVGASTYQNDAQPDLKSHKGFGDPIPLRPQSQNRADF